MPCESITDFRVIFWFDFFSEALPFLKLFGALKGILWSQENQLFCLPCFQGICPLTKGLSICLSIAIELNQRLHWKFENKINSSVPITSDFSITQPSTCVINIPSWRPRKKKQTTARPWRQTWSSTMSCFFLACLLIRSTSALRQPDSALCQNRCNNICLRFQQGLRRKTMGKNSKQNDNFALFLRIVRHQETRMLPTRGRPSTLRTSSATCRLVVVVRNDVHFWRSTIDDLPPPSVPSSS